MSTRSVPALDKARIAVVGSMAAAAIGSGGVALHLAHDRATVTAASAAKDTARATDRRSAASRKRHDSLATSSPPTTPAPHPSASGSASDPGFQPVAPVAPAGSGGTSAGTTGGS
ncbi:MAG: hypothetical protein ABI131_11335 [Nostocoides sp.]